MANSKKDKKEKVEGMSMEKAKKYEMLPIKEFCTKYGGGVTPQAVSYAINHGIVDFIWLGKERLVVMTDKTKGYDPNSHPDRETPSSLGAKINRK